MRGEQPPRPATARRPRCSSTPVTASQGGPPAVVAADHISPRDRRAGWYLGPRSHTRSHPNPRAGGRAVPGRRTPGLPFVLRRDLGTVQGPDRTGPIRPPGTPSTRPPARRYSDDFGKAATPQGNDRSVAPSGLPSTPYTRTSCPTGTNTTTERFAPQSRRPPPIPSASVSSWSGPLRAGAASGRGGRHRARPRRSGVVSLKVGNPIAVVTATAHA